MNKINLFHWAIKEKCRQNPEISDFLDLKEMLDDVSYDERYEVLKYFFTNLAKHATLHFPKDHHSGEYTPESIANSQEFHDLL